MNELRLIRKKLDFDNRSVLSNISKYLYAKGINEKILKEVQLDIASMLLEGQEHGKTAQMSIGENYKTFCDDLIRNCPRKKLI